MRNRYILLADVPLVAIAAAGAFALRFDWLFAHRRPEFLPFLIAALLVKPVIFYCFRMYGRYWEYASVQDLLAVTLAVSAASTCLATLVGLQYAFRASPYEFSRPVVLIDWLLTLALVGGLRMSVRVMGDARQAALKRTTGVSSRRVLIVGAGEAGALVAREMRKNPQLGLVPAGFLDDARSKQHKQIAGTRVMGPIASLAEAVRAYRIDEVVVAMPAVGGPVVRQVVDACRRAGVKSRALPGVFELLDGQVTVSRLRNVEIEDLLRRTSVETRADTWTYLAGRTVLVTGAGGSIGSELSRQIAHARPARLLLLGHGENSIYEVVSQLSDQYPNVTLTPIIADIRDANRIDQIFAHYRPDVVFHAAAHKHVPLMEGNPEEAVSNNVFGTAVIVDSAERHGASRLVLISTDKAVSPLSVMGRTKRIGEGIVRTAATRSGRAFAVVRFGNVLGSRGSVVPLLKRQIERGGPVTVTHPEMRRFFMTIQEAVHLVLKAGGAATGGELFVLNMGEPVRIVDLAEDLIRLSGFEVDDIGIEFTGVRPGEKLNEDLWEPDAVCQPTDERADVFRVVERKDPLSPNILHMVESLMQAARKGGGPALDSLCTECLSESEAGAAGAPASASSDSGTRHAS